MYSGCPGPSVACCVTHKMKEFIFTALGMWFYLSVESIPEEAETSELWVKVWESLLDAPEVARCQRFAKCCGVTMTSIFRGNFASGKHPVDDAKLFWVMTETPDVTSHADVLPNHVPWVVMVDIT
ncbi:hypothetical protein WISP_58350 [Willisornis vidua]|uniref:Uncharacterized protein n=1 Tax=Willisornis vidua TaxID=1566151 RepID=A0ABQ9DH59_9PASS|nr:hypothetical protein WISP_58350 [Willisornis vidua]